MTVKEIVEQWLKDNGYDGLYSPMGECGCCIGEDFIPCQSEGVENCEPGYIVKCKPGDEWEYRIVKDKPEVGNEQV
jgi:hypothetical protein